MGLLDWVGTTFGRRTGVEPSPLELMQAMDARAEANERHRGMMRAWTYYYGYMDEVLAWKFGKEINPNTLVNHARVIVDRHAGFLFGGGVQFPVEDLQDKDTTADAPEDEFLETVWKRSKRESLLNCLSINGSVCGTAFLRIYIEEDGTARLMTPDPATMTVIYDPMDVHRVIEFRSEWNGHEPQTGELMAYRQKTYRDGTGWLIVDEAASKKGAWQEQNRVAWGYPFAPVFYCQNLPAPNSFWGMADLTKDILDLSDRRNLRESEDTKTLHYHAHPLTYAVGVNNLRDGIERDPSVIVPLPMGGELRNLEMQSDLSASQMKILELDKQIYLMAGLTMAALGMVDSAGVLSGVSLKIRFMPTLQRNTLRQALYGEMLAEVNSALLQIGGFGKNRECGVTFADPLPVDTKASADEAAVLEGLGVVSKETLATRLGFDYSVERPKIEAEATAGQEFGAALLDGFNQDGLTGARPMRATRAGGLP